MTAIIDEECPAAAFFEEKDVTGKMKEARIVPTAGKSVLFRRRKAGNMVQNTRMVPQNGTRAPTSRQEGKLRISKHFRPIAYLQANADQLAWELTAGSAAIVITQDGVPSFACVSFKDYCQSQDDAGALVDPVTLGERGIEAGNYMDLSEARSVLDERIRASRSKPKAQE